MPAMVRPLLQSGLAGINAASDSFDGAAGRVTLAAEAPTKAATVRISSQARVASSASAAPGGDDLTSALADTRVAKYAFMANLKVLQSADEISGELTKLGRKT
jgi:hypothetical protein